MATINNSELKKNLIDGAKIQLNIDNVPARLADSVVPTMEVNPKLLKNVDILKTITRDITGNTTLYTVPATRDFYLCGASLSMTKDATCDVGIGVSAQINVPIDGVSSGNNICNVSGLTTTAESKEIINIFEKPIKVSRGSSIVLTGGAYSAGLMVRVGSVWGYLEE